MLERHVIINKTLCCHRPQGYCLELFGTSPGRIPQILRIQDPRWYKMATQKEIPFHERSVGVVALNEQKVQDGYMLMCIGKEQYLLDSQGRRVHEWRSKRVVFSAYLFPDGNLLRDGSDNQFAVAFRQGGAAGYLEVVTWDNEPVWKFSKLSMNVFLTHHDLEIMPNGNVLLMCWERKCKDEALKAGRRPDLIPDNEVWDNLIIELQPDGKGSADIVWQWSLWDHLVQDHDESKSNYAEDVSEHPGCFDINYAPPGGKAGIRNLNYLLGPEKNKERTMLQRGLSGQSVFDYEGTTGEKDWVHANAVSYCPKRDQILVSLNVPCELVIVDHSTTQAESRQRSGGKRGKGGAILWRWGNPQTYRRGDRMDQQLFAQHYPTFIPEGCPGGGNVLVFNNGRSPDRHWTTIDELELPETERWSGDYTLEEGQTFGPLRPVWSYGERQGRQTSFYCTHVSSTQRLPNGNTLVTQGPQGIVFEVTPAKEEVWRYISPCCSDEDAVSFTRQGESRSNGRYTLFTCLKYPAAHPAFAGRSLTPGRRLED